MKKLLLTTTLCLLSFCLFAQTVNQPFEFVPLVQLKGLPYTQKVGRLQIPESTLKQMTTEALVETCINYPLFPVITSFSDLQEGFNRVSIDFNGFAELYSRPDAGKAILNRYKSYKLEDLKTISDSESRGKYVFKLAFCELLIAQTALIDKFDKDNLTELMAVGYEKLTEKSRLNISTFNRQFSLLVMGKALVKVDSRESADFKNDADLQGFFSSAVLKNQATSKKILDAVNKQLTSK